MLRKVRSIVLLILLASYSSLQQWFRPLYFHMATTLAFFFLVCVEFLYLHFLMALKHRRLLLLKSVLFIFLIYLK